MQATYTATADEATIIPPRLHFNDIEDLVQYIRRYKPRADGGYTYDPESIGECDVRVELDGGLIFEVGLRLMEDMTHNALIVEGIDSETGRVLDLIYNDEAREFIAYLEKLRG